MFFKRKSSTEDTGPKAAYVVIGSKPVQDDRRLTKRRFDPVTVEILKESDLKPEHIVSGPKPPREGRGDKTWHSYITVDGQRLVFDANGQLL